MLTSLDQKASEAGGEFKIASETAHKVEGITKNFYGYVNGLKTTVLKDTEVNKETGKLPYEAMDKGQNLDESWFSPDALQWI